MRDKIVALVMCALLAVSLFACGDNRGTPNDSDVLGDEQQNSSGTNGSSNGGTNGTTNGTNGTNNGTANGSTNGTNNGTSNGTTNGTNNDANTGSNTDQNITTGNNAKQSDVMGDSALRGSTINPANGNVDRTATWEQMLQNGRVHDRDGFLFDGENSHWA